MFSISLFFELPVVKRAVIKPPLTFNFCGNMRFCLLFTQNRHIITIHGTVFWMFLISTVNFSAKFTWMKIYSFSLLLETKRFKLSCNLKGFASDTFFVWINHIEAVYGVESPLLSPCGKGQPVFIEKKSNFLSFFLSNGRLSLFFWFRHSPSLFLICLTIAFLIIFKKEIACYCCLLFW